MEDKEYVKQLVIEKDEMANKIATMLNVYSSKHSLHIIGVKINIDYFDNSPYVNIEITY